MNKKSKIYLFTTMLIVFIVYSFSLNRQWQFFDERVFYNEGLFPISSSINELFEVIKTYAFTYHMDSQNAFFSNIVNVRSNTLGPILQIFILFLLKKNALSYHIVEIAIHLINSLFVWFLLFKLLNSDKPIITSLFTLLWSLHPVNVEAVLLSTNWISLLTYSFCLGLLLILVNKIHKNKYQFLIGEFLIVTLLFTVSLLISEYSYTLPFIALALCFAIIYSQTSHLYDAFKKSAVLSLPLFLGIIIYLLIFTLIPHSIISNLFSSLSHTFFERNLWLSPQIFIHFLKIIFFPKSLSIYQSNLITLGEGLIEPYTIFCTLSYLSFLILPAALFLIFRKKGFSFVFILFYLFYFSIFPFLHAITPTYCIIAERYCYFPLFFLVLFLAILAKNKKLTLVLLIAILLPLSARTIFRINDWKDTFSLYNSALRCSKDSLYTGQIHSVLAYYFNSIGKINEANKYIASSKQELITAIQKLSNKTYPLEPKTLNEYGLDNKSLRLRAAFTIADMFDNYSNYSKNAIFVFYEPFIEPVFNFAGNSQLVLYAKLLKDTNNEEKAIDVLEYTRKKYPYSPFPFYDLSNIYLENKDIQNAERIIKEGYNLYPSYPRMLVRTIKLAELKNDLESFAKYEYLLGLRIHSVEGYQKSAQLYLILNDLKNAKKVLNKLTELHINDGITSMLLKKYIELSKK